MNDQEFITATAKAAAHDAAHNVIALLPCKDHINAIKSNQEMLIKHEALLTNGLLDAVVKLNKAIETHIDDHRQDQQIREKNKRAFWRTLLVGSIAPLITGVVVYTVIKIIGG